MRYFIILSGAFLFAFTASAGSPPAPPYIGYSDYQIVTDRSFDPAPYFQEMARAGLNLQRLWAMGYGNTDDRLRELQPFARHGRKYDLHRINPRYLDRLNRVFREADENGLRLMFTLFDRWQIGTAERFVRTPWYYKNNTTKYLRNAFPDFHNLENPGWAEIQENYVKTLVRETRAFHPIYEIMNEPSLPGDCAGLVKWHERVASWILQEAPDAEIAVNMYNECDSLAEIRYVRWVTLHYAGWNTGICEAIEPIKAAGKQVVIDTDGAFPHRDTAGRLRQWYQESLACGASFNHKDDIYKLDREALRVLSEKSN